MQSVPPVLTVEDLSQAISHKIGIDAEDAKRDANFIMDLFGFEDRIVDNVLEPEDRQLIYMLDEEGMFSSGREETQLYDGREWRTHYWYLKPAAVKAMSEAAAEQLRRRKAQPTEHAVYAKLPDEVWASRQI